MEHEARDGRDASDGLDVTVNRGGAEHWKNEE